jgi:hypothetical protein
MKGLVFCVALALVCPIAWGQLEGDDNIVVPDMPSADMRMSWKDFKELLVLMQPAAETEEEEAEPLFPWSISAVTYAADARDDGAVRVRARFEIQVWAEDWVAIPIIGTAVALSEVKLDGQPFFLKQSKEWSLLITNSPGAHTLEVAFFVPTTEKDGTVHFKFPSAAAAVTQMKMRLGLDAAGVSSPMAAGVQTSKQKGYQEAEIFLRSADSVQVSWRRPTQTVAKPVAPPPRVASEVLTWVEVTESFLMCEATVNYEVLRGATDRFTFQLPLDAIVLDVNGAGADWTTVEMDGMQQVQVAVNHEVTGQYPLKLRWEWPITPGDSALNVPRLVTEDVARQAGRIYIAAEGNIKVSVSGDSTNVMRTAPDSHAWPEKPAPVLHAFRYGRPDYALQLNIHTEQPRVACEANTLASAGGRLLTLESQVVYTVLRGEVSRLSLALPLDVKLLDVEGEGMEWTVAESETDQTITVNLNGGVRDLYSLLLRYEAPVLESDAAVNIPVLTVHDVARQTGHVAVATGGNVKVDVAAEAEGATRIDVTELPPAVNAAAQSPILHAFEYLEPNYTVPLTIQRLDDVAVRVASIDHAQLTTVVSEEGMVITRARYVVRNNQRQFLRIDPGPDVEIWGAQVDGRVVSPAKDTDSESAVLLQLRKSHEGTTGLGGFPVELIYMKRMESPRGLTHTLGLTAPSTDILIDAVNWEVLLPKGRHYVTSSGDVEALKSAKRGSHPDRGELLMGEVQNIMRFREGIERFMITDINNPAGSAVGQSKTFGGKAYAQGIDTPASTRLAGVLPVHINLPQTGVAHLFSRKLVPQSKALSLQIRTYNTSFSKGIGWMAYPVAIFLGILLAHLVRHGAQRNREALGLVVLATLTGWILWFASQTAPAGYIVVALCVALGATAYALYRYFEYPRSADSGGVS